MKKIIALSMLSLVFAACDASNPAPGNQPPPADNPQFPLEGNWSLQSASCDDVPVQVFPGMITLSFAANRQTMRTHFGTGCEFEPATDVVFPSAGTFIFSNMVLNCIPIGCDQFCGSTSPTAHTVNYVRNGNSLLLESTDGTQPDFCKQGQMRKLRFEKI